MKLLDNSEYKNFETDNIQDKKLLQCSDEKRLICLKFANKFLAEIFESALYYPASHSEIFLPKDECVSCLYGKSILELPLRWRLILE